MTEEFVESTKRHHDELQKSIEVLEKQASIQGNVRKRLELWKKVHDLKVEMEIESMRMTMKMANKKLMHVARLSYQKNQNQSLK